MSNSNLQVNVNSNVSNSNWQQLKTNGYYPNWAYEYVKTTIMGKVFKEGIKSINDLYEVYSSELYDLGLSMGLKDKQIQYAIQNYGLKCLDYWINKLGNKLVP